MLTLFIIINKHFYYNKYIFTIKHFQRKINLFYKDYFNKLIITSLIINIALLIVKPIVKFIKPAFKQKCNCLIKNMANKQIKNQA